MIRYTVTIKNIKMPELEKRVLDAGCSVLHSTKVGTFRVVVIGGEMINMLNVKLKDLEA